MSMQRISWDELPPAARAAVAEQTGPVHTATTASDGVNSGIAARLQTSTGDVFVKGVPIDHPQIHTQHREADINPHLPATCPRLLWQVQAAGWDLLGFEQLAGRSADFSPGSADLPKVVAALEELARTPCPDLPLKRVDQRWSAYTDPDMLPLLGGDHLLHTDLAPHNVLVDDTAHLIDWAWPTRGPDWVDPAVWVIRLIDTGHTPTQAEDWAAHLSAWQAAPTAAVTTFAHANAAMWDEISTQDPASAWKKNMAASAHHWSAHRARRHPPARSSRDGSPQCCATTRTSDPMA